MNKDGQGSDFCIVKKFLDKYKKQINNLDNARIAIEKDLKSRDENVVGKTE